MAERSDKPVIIIAIAIIAVILIGEVVVYTSDYTDYSADAALNDDGVLEYSVSADGSKVFSVIVNDNGRYAAMDRLYIYYDPDYKSNYEKVNVPIGAKELNQEYYIQQLISTLRFHNLHNIEVVDADGLRSMMDRESGIGLTNSGLVVISGALPDTVYRGTQDDVIFDWLSSGGRLYWLGNIIGSCYATNDELVNVDGYQELFFGSECINTDPDANTALNEVTSNDYASALSLMNNKVKYGIDGSLIPSDRRHLEIGFTDGKYSSTSLVEYGNGMICVLGGDYSNNQRSDLAQIISSGLTPESRIVGFEEGSVTRGTVTGTIEVIGDNLSSYIYLGGYYPVYGKLVYL